MLLLALCGCSGTDARFNKADRTAVLSLRDSISKSLQTIIDNADGSYDTGGYIVYSAKENVYLEGSELIYGLAYIFSKWMNGETTDTTSESTKSFFETTEENGWTKAGICKEKPVTLNLANKIANEIPANRDFEIHAEKQKDGNYIVWYRLM